MNKDNMIETMVQEAIKARRNSYSPYSHYQVGCALVARKDEGSPRKIFYGTNVENASYGLTICAERSALFGAISNGYLYFDAMAVVTKDGGTSCGACRQVILELTPENMPVYFYTVREGGEIMDAKTFFVKELLPHPFKLD